jgi:hypothetical protein
VRVFRSSRSLGHDNHPGKKPNGIFPPEAEFEKAAGDGCVWLHLTAVRRRTALQIKREPLLFDVGILTESLTDKENSEFRRNQADSRYRIFDRVCTTCAIPARRFDGRYRLNR